MQQLGGNMTKKPNAMCKVSAFCMQTSICLNSVSTCRVYKLSLNPIVNVVRRGLIGVCVLETKKDVVNKPTHVIINYWVKSMPEEL